MTDKTEQLPGIGKIHSAIAEIMSEVGGVAKTRKNESQNYKFRGIADITKACQPVMSKHGVHVTPHAVLQETVTERQTAKGGAMLHIRQQIEFRFYHADGSYFPCVTTGEAMDSGDKTSNKVMSAALKYALTQTFCIPEEDPDADTETASPELGERKAAPVTLAPGRAEVGLTDSDIEQVGALAKKAGYSKHADIKPLLQTIGGVDSLRLLERRYLADLISTLERKAGETIAKDVEEIFGAASA